MGCTPPPMPQRTGDPETDRFLLDLVRRESQHAKIRQWSMFIWTLSLGAFIGIALLLIGLDR